MEGRFYMSESELNRLDIVKQIEKKALSVSDAAKLLNISTRQVGRLRRIFKEKGPKGLISKKIGAVGNHKVPEEQEKLVLKLFKDERFQDFGPTLAYEYLKESWKVNISLSSVRAIMIRHGLWTPCVKRKAKIHPLRERRMMVGELTQLDGSDHAWFEGRGPRCTLLVFVDDATSMILHLKFVKSENLRDYFFATREYIKLHGVPRAFYVDKHSVFKINHKGPLSGEGRTQFTRAMVELGSRVICANSPQAKGRVERRNRDLQDRLVKALRIANICEVEAANAFTDNFIKKFNQQFAKPPQNPLNAHKPINKTQNLDRIFCLKSARHLSKNLSFQYENILYQVHEEKQANRLRNTEITILKSLEGKISVEKDGKPLQAIPFCEVKAPLEEVSAKDLQEVLKESLQKKKKYKPPHYHPWKIGYKRSSPS